MEDLGLGLLVRYRELERVMWRGVEGGVIRVGRVGMN